MMSALKSWFTSHAQAFARALSRMRAQPLASTLSILVIAIAILLPLGLYTVFANVTSAAARLNTDPNVNVYLALTATEVEAKEIEKKLRANANAADVKFISREAALADMKNRAGLGDLLAGIETNPLPHAFAIRPKSTDTAALDAMRRDIGAIAKVETINMDLEWAKKLTRFARFAERLVLLLGLLLGAAVVFVVGNTIRLQMLTQKDEIVVARLIGATRRFVRRPFLYFGALQGGFAGALAVLAVVGLAAWAGGEVNALAASYGADFIMRAPGIAQATGVTLAGAALGWIGAYVSVSMYWRSIEAAK
jgi:cell division transport system permease protein